METLKDIYKADSAIIEGSVKIGNDSSIWHHAIIRGDEDTVSVGSCTNIQDGAVLHEDTGKPLRIGDRVTIGHRAIVHGCTVEDDVLIGMGAIVMNGAVIGKGSIIGAGAVVLENMIIPPESIAVGSPARVIGTVRPEQIEKSKRNALEYVRLAQENLKRL